jgi:hypothetical protein
MSLHILHSGTEDRRCRWQRFVYRGHVEIHLPDGRKHYARCLEITFFRITVLLDPAVALADPVVVAVPLPLLMNLGRPALSLPARTVYRSGVRRQLEFLALSRAKRFLLGKTIDALEVQTS